MGDEELEGDWSFKQISVDVPKKNFGKSNLVKNKLKAIFNDFDWVMIPVEKKNIVLFLYAIKLRGENRNVRLFSYNHPVLKSGNGKITLIDKWMTKWYYKKLDRVIFYTEDSCKWALDEGLIVPQKAYWANNTVDNIEIKKQYTDLVKLAQDTEQIYRAKYGFKPIVGHSYHLYYNGREEFLSIMSPEEWSVDGDRQYLGSFTFTTDLIWERTDND